MKKLVLFIFSLAIFSCGQDSHLIEGKITNESGQAIDSVLIQVMGTDLNSYSDSEGQFRINTKQRGHELIFSKSGYNMQRLEIDDQTQLEVSLHPE